MMKLSFRIGTQNGKTPHCPVSLTRKRFSGGVILAQALMQDDDTRRDDDWSRARQRFSEQ
jgi:hypothetical protein